ncbi:hypothetical protein CGC49_09875 [Capnocytophaga sp. H4358]|uniref:DUF4091 domain-containing protein n=1 Tax=Capnocytophaga TaxID=1016 RepID=UPI000BB1E411|nr:MULTISPECIES: DUF4091 domain-containing protein [Capnocytophaga]ATA73561.1 hypothetical protein CGC49_09875 [Capnocytophaga sp. H4358]
MKKCYFLLWLFLILSMKAQENQGITHSKQLTGQVPFPKETFIELPNPVKANPQEWKNFKGTTAGWGSTDVRYKKETPAKDLKLAQTLTAWKGERISGQIVVVNANKDAEISVDISDFRHTKLKNNLKKEHISADFIRYVMTDELNKDGKGGCGYRTAINFDSTLVADAIDHYAKKLVIPAQTSRGIWVKVQVPQNVVSGSYKGFISVKNKGKVFQKLSLEIKVLDRVLPASKDWHFHLDLWQNPYAVSRYHNLRPWSKEHFDKLRIEMQPYVEAGGKSITASIMHKPWGGQTYDAFGSMVTWFKKLDGSWHFDFAVFDKWVEFMHEMGITKQINCYSMVPWKLSFQYFDQATNQVQKIETQPGKPEYNEVWGAMLTAFAKHLKGKGWFEKTYISMDERPMKVMLETLKVIKQADPNFKVSFAGDWHEEIEADLDDYCVALWKKFSDDVKNKRREQGKISTYYTCCTEPYPNTFTFSEPAESEWLGWFVAKENLDGYLRWALNSWTIEPLLDSRFVSWAAGDTYLTYPLGRSSIRMERMIEGIQNYEKVRILREEFKKSGNIQALEKIEEVLQTFDEYGIPKIPAKETVSKAKYIINSL